MPLKKQAFASLAQKLRSALDAGEWETVRSLDEECGTLVASLSDEDATDAGLRAEIDAMATLYEELQLTGRAERERLAAELTKLNQAKQVSRAYKPLG
ncbi:flagellar protein FliT [Stutzerimonas frequens]|uniref:Flagellar protein FliT n=1 Tax=Stutzerimonas frequens TaxID=2968969 RepID=A0ABX6XQC7_9GAMM|nr:flagellar protein FliT [Stutzerimonas frequens]MCQ4305609.1 flagellar protein FliT [Stutzerimonas frequens]PNF49223.1 flagellar protein FliT [Stutzerimonas frequens]QPT16489.1 flagellar protein FliT [Stutzerimonas frequens]